MISSVPAKRRKLGDSAIDGEGTDEEVQADILRAWEHYRNFIDGDVVDAAADEECAPGADTDEDRGDEGAADEGGGDVDELMELMEILSPRRVRPLASCRSSCPAEDDTMVTPLRRIGSLLAVLLSMSHLHLASHAISEEMFDPNQAGDSEEGCESSAGHHFERALHYWPTNPAAHSLLANYHRMNSLSSAEDVLARYVRASECAHLWRRLALELLRSPDDEEVVKGVNAKEWVELLILNGALDVDYVGEDEEEEDDEDDNSNVCDKKLDEDEYSCSMVESTASFMSAFLLSTLSRHDDALRHLRKFRLSHRVHPNVWRRAQGRAEVRGNARTNGDDDKCEGGHKELSAPFCPRLYYKSAALSAEGGQGDGVLPPDVYSRLCALFAPNASYWKESDYANRGYYSYFLDLDSPGAEPSAGARIRPTNVVEDAIVNHLLPLAERTLEESASSPPRIVGAEWWVHTRPVGANLGHQVHFDTDESLLGREGRATHPVISSVLYLTGASDDAGAAGATVVFDQTPASERAASRAWTSRPRDNAFLTFPGDLLHGVLPCSGARGNGRGRGGGVHRLTFMVGFWTRNVAEGGGERELYSPAGPLPPASPEHSWVTQSQRSYGGDGGINSGGIDEQRREIAFIVPPSASPAWERFDSNCDDPRGTSGPALTIPKGLDHRFFVMDAPGCFSRSLFDKEDTF